MRKATDYKITFHGIDNEQYFPGAGVSFTKWTECATGLGNCNAEALNDALDLLAQNDWDADTLEREMVSRSFDGRPLRDEPDDSLGPDFHYYVTVYVTDKE